MIARREKIHGQPCFALHENNIWLTFLQYIVATFSWSWCLGGRMPYFHLKTTYHCSPIGFASSQSHNPTFFALCATTFILLAFLSSYHCEKNSRRFFSRRNVYSRLFKILISIFLGET